MSKTEAILEYRIAKYKEKLTAKLKYNKRQTGTYQRLFVRTNKQADRHSAMQYHARTSLLQELIKGLEV